MKARTPIIPTKETPRFVDGPLIEMNEFLVSNLPWLDQAFGKIERLIEGKGRSTQATGTRPIKYPGIYTGIKSDKGYLNLLPDGKIGNYSYVEIYKEPLNHEPKQFTDHEIEFGIVFWYNFEKVYTDNHKNMTNENVKYDVFEKLDRKNFQSFKLRFTEFKEGANEIYRGFDHNEIDHQFLMRPYGGFKLMGKMRFTQQCGL